MTGLFLTVVVEVGGKVTFKFLVLLFGKSVLVLGTSVLVFVVEELIKIEEGTVKFKQITSPKNKKLIKNLIFNPIVGKIS